MNKPTEAQIKEFREWYGLEYLEGSYYYKGKLAFGRLVGIDLNNLFKYAVPIAIKIIMAEQECDEELAYAILFKKWLQIGYDALALFWALWQVKEKSND